MFRHDVSPLFGHHLPHHRNCALLVAKVSVYNTKPSSQHRQDIIYNAIFMRHEIGLLLGSHWNTSSSWLPWKRVTGGAPTAHQLC